MSVTTRWMGNVACIGKIKNAHKIVIRKDVKRDKKEGLVLVRRKVLKWKTVLKK
jgi:hypothetical protein